MEVVLLLLGHCIGYLKDVFLSDFALRFDNFPLGPLMKSSAVPKTLKGLSVRAYG